MTIKGFLPTACNHRGLRRQSSCIGDGNRQASAVESLRVYGVKNIKEVRTKRGGVAHSLYLLGFEGRFSNELP
jgi:hypothetical protein